MSRNQRNSLPGRRARFDLPRMAAIAIAVLVLAAFNACNESSLPTAPPPPTQSTPPQAPRTTSDFTGNIMDADTNRVCIPNARVEVLAGPLSGKVYAQNLEWCEESSLGFTINDLPIGSVLSLRLSAPGYTSADRDFVIQSSAGSIDVQLKRAG